MKVNYKKIRKIFFLTLLLFSMCAFCVLSTTTSKYYAYNDSRLLYNIKYKGLAEKEITLEFDRSSSNAPETFGLLATFYRSNYVLDTDVNVKYTFEIDSACKITKVLNSKGTLNKDDKTLIYSNPNITADLDNKIEVYYTCDADSILEGNNLVTSFSVTEQFKAKGSLSYENKTYSLGEKEIVYPYNLFYTIIPEIKDGVLYIPKTYAKSKYKYILDNYMLSGEEKEYFKSKYLSDDSNIKEDKLLPGFVVSENDDYYIYKKTENFTSYAYTYADNGVQFWFLSKSSTNESLISLLTEYLDVYTTYTTQEKIDLIAYIKKSKPTLKELLECTDNSKRINGVHYSSNRWIVFKSDIWLYVYPPKTLAVNYTDDEDTIIDILLDNLRPAFGFVSNNNFAQIEPEILDPLLEKPDKEKYTYLGPYSDGTQTVVVLIHAVPEEGKEYISIYEVTVGENYVLSFVKASTDAETVTNINTTLGYFGTDVVITEAMLNNPDSYDVITITDGKINISFTARDNISESNLDTE